MVLVKRPVCSISAALCCAAIASSAILFSGPDLVFTHIASVVEAFAGFDAWLTPPVLFLLVNGAIMCLASTSGFLNQRRHLDHSEEPEDLLETSRREHCDHANEEAAKHEEEETTGDWKDGEQDDGFCPEMLSSFFSDGVTIAARKRFMRRSASAPSAQRKSWFFNPSMSSSSSQKRSFSPNLLPETNYTMFLRSQPLHKVLQQSHTLPKSRFEARKHAVLIENANGDAEDKYIDQKAAAFIDRYYKNSKQQQVDPRKEWLERSYGR